MKKLLTLLSLLTIFFISGLFANASRSKIVLNSFESNSVSVNVLESTNDYTVVELILNYYEKQEVLINNENFLHLFLKSEGVNLDKGNPELPLIGRSVMIPGTAKMHYEIIKTEYSEISGKIAPSKGSLLRNVNPADVPYEFSEVYKKDSFYPENIVDLGEPYILREIRGLAFRITPFAYNPVQEKIRVYNKIVLKIFADGYDDINIMTRSSNIITRDFASLYRNQFINYQNLQSRYETIEEQGSILVISFPAFMTAVQPYVDWKNQKGIPTVMVSTNQTGTTHQAIKTYIQNYWDDNPELAFVQLVGDAAQIPTPTHAGGGSDPSYVMLVGNDHYPDLFIGRFSAENIAQVETQVQRTIYYERDIVDGDWLSKGTGVASNEGPGDNGEYDHQHLNVIRNLLLDYTYDHVDQFYQPQATAAQVTNAVNQGRSFINYTGHGSQTTWVTTGFSNNHVNALTNDNKLPFIVSVACVNGDFTGTTCFAEAWLRATNNTTGAPTGAINMYAATINQPWYPPMRAQDVIVELLIAEEKNTIGGLFFNGSSAMLDVYNTTDGINTMRTWHIFGDASLQVRTTAPDIMTINAPETLFTGLSTYTITTNTENALAALYDPENQALLGFAYTNATGIATIELTEPLSTPTTLLLTVSGYNKVTDIREVSVIPNDGPYIVLDSAINQATGNNSLDFASTTNLQISINNVGTENAENLNIVLSSNTNIAQVINSTANVTSIPAETVFTIPTLFSVSINTNIENHSFASFTLTVTSQSGAEWTMPVNLPINAPSISETNLLVIDTNGNNNGKLDPGETAQLKITFENTGNLDSLTGQIIATSTNPFVTINIEDTVIPVISANNTLDYYLTVIVSEEAEPGSITHINYIADFQSQVINKTHAFSIGLIVEDFESGDFSSHNWVHQGNQPWIVVSNDSYEGTYSAKSGNISHSQSSTLQIEHTSVTAGEIQFALKVSSEANYDFLKFFINGSQAGSWSGSMPWTEVSFNVNPGTNVFRWTYSKDGSISSGSDCAWIDYIVFPTGNATVYAPEIAVSVDHINLGTIEINQVANSTFTITNEGNSNLSGTIQVSNGFSLNNTNNFVISPSENINYTLSFQTSIPGVYQGNITINSNDINNSQITIPVIVNVTLENGEIIQSISLLEGWNILSSYAIPQNSNLLNIFNNLISSNQLIKIMDQAGNSMEYMGNEWINNIGNLSETESYRVKVAENISFNLQGIQTELPLEITLNQGWNLISYPYANQSQAILFLQSLIDNNLLEKVIDERGNTIESLPEIGWINNLNNFVPGKGYAIRVSENTSLIYPELDLNMLSEPAETLKDVVEPRNTNYFVKNWNNNGWNHFNMYIINNTFITENLNVGDEIALFDGQNCVAAAVFNGQNNYIRLIASMSDSQDAINGYINGNNWSLKIWKQSENTVYTVNNLDILQGDSSFQKGNSSVVKMLDYTSNADLTSPLVTEINSIYPNPFNPTTNISFSLHKADNINLEIYNVRGQKVTSLASGMYQAGSYNISWSGTDSSNKAVASGIYFARLVSSDKQMIKKMVLIK